MRQRGRLLATALTSAFVSGCGGLGSAPPPPASYHPVGLSSVVPTTADSIAGGPCSLSWDGVIWYTVAAGSFAPIDFTQATCTAAATIDAHVVPTIPTWARPSGPTRALFVATSLQEAYSPDGMQALAALGAAAKVPLTWMVGNPTYLRNDGAYYDRLHASDGDDVEVEDYASLYQLARSVLPWFGPSVSVEGAGHERNIPQLEAYGDVAFWGITWNSHGTDNTSDEGTPWGTYCADTTSYKRPSPSGDCSLLAFEWTARDLTRAYLADTDASGYSSEAAFSTDPDDISKRGGFDESSGQQYERSLVDAYAAAGQTQPLVMMSQQESLDESVNRAVDDPLIGALYQEAVRDGMQATTLRGASASARTFSTMPRAVAFPYIPGGKITSYDGANFTPGTIDYHDNVAGMTFVAGHTLPSRLFTYAADPTSSFDRTLVQSSALSAPRLTAAGVANGEISFSFVSPQPVHYGVALWTDPARLMLSGANVTPAGHAGAVVTFDLPAGASTQTVRCMACTSTTFSYSR